MLAVVIDPVVCHSSIWWMFPECWGIAVMVGVSLTAVGCAALRLRVRRTA